MTSLKTQTPTPISSETLEAVMIEGDLAQLSAAQRIEYYREVCESLEINPLTRPFEYIKFQGKLTLYAKKDATEQLAAKRNISVTLDDGQEIGGTYLVKARAAIHPGGRFADATGVVALGNLKGDNLANALMKAETKASRRAVLRLVGLGWLDQTETESIEGAVYVEVDQSSDEISDPEPQEATTQQRKTPTPLKSQKTLARKWGKAQWKEFIDGLTITPEQLATVVPDGKIKRADLQIVANEMKAATPTEFAKGFNDLWAEKNPQEDENEQVELELII
jgi:hypothetical protein